MKDRQERIDLIVKRFGWSHSILKFCQNQNVINTFLALALIISAFAIKFECTSLKWAYLTFSGFIPILFVLAQTHRSYLFYQANLKDLPFTKWFAEIKRCL